jgi:DNA-binding response OmpR family regulator
MSFLLPMSEPSWCHDRPDAPSVRYGLPQPVAAPTTSSVDPTAARASVEPNHATKSVAWTLLPKGESSVEGLLGDPNVIERPQRRLGWPAGLAGAGAKQTMNTTSAHHATAGTSGAQLILVIDDAPAEIGMLIATLSEAGYRVRAAPDGSDALEQVRSHTPDLILLSARMSGSDAFETCRQLRQLVKLADTPIIFMIALAKLEDRASAFAVGADDYVMKPFQYRETLGRVRMHLRQRRLECELERLHRDLDKRVSERTLELKLALAECETLRSRLHRENDSLTEQLRERARS